MARKTNGNTTTRTKKGAAVHALSCRPSPTLRPPAVRNAARIAGTFARLRRLMVTTSITAFSASSFQHSFPDMADTRRAGFARWSSQ